jgi:hypothetical protein
VRRFEQYSREPLLTHLLPKEVKDLDFDQGLMVEPLLVPDDLHCADAPAALVVRAL